MASPLFIENQIVCCSLYHCRRMKHYGFKSSNLHWFRIWTYQTGVDLSTNKWLFSTWERYLRKYSTCCSLSFSHAELSVIFLLAAFQIDKAENTHFLVIFPILIAWLLPKAGARHLKAADNNLIQQWNAVPFAFPYFSTGCVYIYG